MCASTTSAKCNNIGAACAAPKNVHEIILYAGKSVGSVSTL